ncbi:MAG TPA: fused MFS/spermidine synthase [Burkholderiaceae bacterium]|nr:fused MFS/spermidine synthase [Burkholderiaceae bacterium]
MILHAATIALSAFLLFLVQPIVARQILPWFGGSAAVWTTCMVFFQVVLLAGYFYSDVVIRRLAPRPQAILHTVLLVASLAFLPILIPEAMKPTDASQPVLRILGLLAATIGLPYLMLATTGPLVQAWFTRRFSGARVYRLYALSNLASMLALVGYPPLIEPNSSGRLQSIGWSVGYAAFAVLAIAAAWSAVRAGPAAVPAAPAGGGPSPVPEPMRAAHEAAGAPIGVPRGDAPPRAAEQALWLTLAALGSVLLLSVTTHITQNVASIPFLWVLPLAIYLITFILCFDGTGWYWRPQYATLAAIACVAMLAGLSFRPEGAGVERAILRVEHAVPVYAFGLFVLCMFLHGELVARKPAPAHLTRFYLMVSLGGAVGGLLVGIAAPLAFAWYWELPLALTVVALLVAALSRGGLRAAGAVATIACALLLGDYVRWIRDDVIELSRNFYGTLRVKAAVGDDPAEVRHRLLHGVILHGEQFMNGEARALPTTYYGPGSGIGVALKSVQARGAPMRVGLIGLGVGTLAAYGRPGDTYRLYELNPVVPDIARRHFTYLADSLATIETELGDARLVLEREAPQRYDVLAVDAFSSDSIPVHLLTREALAVYRRHLAPGGTVVFHVTNRYLDLTGVVRRLADEAGMKAVMIDDDPPADSPLLSSTWIALTADDALAGTMRAAGGTEPAAPPARRETWTDDHHNLFEVLK